MSWDIEFADDKGRALWRACGLCVLGAVALFSCAQLGVWRWQGRSDFWSRLRFAIAAVMYVVGATAYVTARLILIYLTVKSFSDLPVGVYDDIDWLQYIPVFH